ncbi:AAA family ATPase [Desulfonauticus submarinus]
MKRLPLDTSSFSQLRSSGDLYVDKTFWIHKLVTQGRCYFLSRPRRFGKSLTINTLKELFQGRKELFQGLYIYDKWEFAEHPVIVFDFNGIKHNTPENFELALQKNLLEQAEQYEVSVDVEDIVAGLKYLIRNLYRKTGRNVVVLIDEYDKPIISHLGLGEKRYQIALKNRDLMKEFFGVLKESSVVDVLQFVFVTGVSAFTKVSIFSEWNNLTDITDEPFYADFLGYTEEELKKYLGEYLDVFCHKHEFADRDKCLKKIRYWYNGYRFSPHNETRVYNPISVMYSLSKGYFDNWWFKTATPSFLVNLLKERSYLIPELEHLEVAKDFLSAFDLEDIRIEPLLFQTGYLTIKEFDGQEFIKLGYPNQEVKRSLSAILLEKLYRTSPGTRKIADDLGKALYREDREEIKEKLNQILSQIPYPLYEKADEKFFHTVFYLSLCLLGYDAEAEPLSPGGRGDMAVQMKGKAFILEFKARGSVEDAFKQIEEKGYARRFEGKALKIVRVAVVFDVEKRCVKDVAIN